MADAFENDRDLSTIDVELTWVQLDLLRHGLDRLRQVEWDRGTPSRLYVLEELDNRLGEAEHELARRAMHSEDPPL